MKKENPVSEKKSVAESREVHLYHIFTTTTNVRCASYGPYFIFFCHSVYGLLVKPSGNEVVLLSKSYENSQTQTSLTLQFV